MMYRVRHLRWESVISFRTKKVVMVVSGEDKADAVQKAFFGPVTPEVPASILQLHPDFTLVADEAALKKVLA